MMPSVESSLGETFLLLMESSHVIRLSESSSGDGVPSYGAAVMKAIVAATAFNISFPRREDSSPMNFLKVCRGNRRIGALPFGCSYPEVKAVKNFQKVRDNDPQHGLPERGMFPAIAMKAIVAATAFNTSFPRREDSSPMNFLKVCRGNCRVGTLPFGCSYAEVRDVKNFQKVRNNDPQQELPERGMFPAIPMKAIVAATAFNTWFPRREDFSPMNFLKVCRGNCRIGALSFGCSYPEVKGVKNFQKVRNNDPQQELPGRGHVTRDRHQSHRRGNGFQHMVSTQGDSSPMNFLKVCRGNRRIGALPFVCSYPEVKAVKNFQKVRNNDPQQELPERAHVPRDHHESHRRGNGFQHMVSSREIFLS